MVGWLVDLFFARGSYSLHLVPEQLGAVSAGLVKAAKAHEWWRRLGRMAEEGGQPGEVLECPF